MPTVAPTIKQLPESVTVRLRSTLVITTLSDAISELVQNSLDAGARNIKIQANLLRNSCVVEDDGVGIAPVDVSMVGKMYATSKFPLPPSLSPTTFGFRGQALGSLATHSLFTLTSRHHEHRSTHTIRISYSTPVFTGLAPEHLRLPAAGTIVRIEGLWGDMPVRLKARQQEDVEREWEDVNRVIVQLLLTPQGKGVGVIARDEGGNRRLAVKDGNLGTWELSVLRQVYGREVVGSGWEKVRAQQGGVKIEGWICTRGSGTREFQFLYINNHPLPPSTTLLHAEINRVLGASSFGVVEEDENRTSGSKVRTGPRKGVEKWGMFILRIECINGDISVLGGEGGTGGKSGLEGDHLNSAINLLQKLIREFLKTHHFRPLSAPPSNPRNSVETRKACPSTVDLVEEGVTGSRSSSSTPLGTIKDNSSSVSGTSEMTDSTHRDLRALATWSRIKSARLDPNEEEGRQMTGFKTTDLTFSAHPPPRMLANPIDAGEVGLLMMPEIDGLVDAEDDGYVTWTNPISKKSFQVNNRTGNTATTGVVISDSMQFPQSIRMKRSASRLSCPGGRPEDDFSAKRSRRSKSADTGSKGTFVEQLLKNWKNPVFKANEAPIPQLITAEAGGLGYTSCDCANGFVETTSTTLGKLTKGGLRNAQVIAQVDQKYILIKMRGFSTDDGGIEGPEQNGCELLVIVDQHAADERVRVESLFTEICAMDSCDLATEELHASGPTQKTLIYTVSRREWELMRRYEDIFREWGISYYLSPNPPKVVGLGGRQGRENGELSLSIYSLPRAITERCINEPTLAIDMIRKHVYELSEKPTVSTYTNNPRRKRGGDWVKRIGSCPKGLLDMVNSKACRSAIMFNDPLSLNECRVLIGKLGQCTFPFQCAHGRPSMIPLVDLRVPPTLELGVGKENVIGEGFKRDFEKWVQREGEIEG